MQAEKPSDRLLTHRSGAETKVTLKCLHKLTLTTANTGRKCVVYLYDDLLLAVGVGAALFGNFYILTPGPILGALEWIRRIWGWGWG